jgi:peptidoglycan/LPS O-acetylase OafA/YrhL
MALSKTVSARNSGIDLLRGLSIVLVIIHHTVSFRLPLRKTALAEVVPKRIIDALSFNGYEAVFIFFVISGFLITTNALQRWGKLRNIDLRAFYRRRASRILPCLLLLVAVLSALHLLRVHDYVIEKPEQSLGRAIFSALGLHLNWYEGRYGYLPGSWDVLWSLSIEEVFYLGVPLLCLTLGRTRLFVPILAALALSLPFTHAALAGNEIWQEKAYLPGMAAIATGVLAALVAARGEPSRRAIVPVMVCAGWAGIGAVLFFEDILWKPLRDGTMLILTFSSAALCIGFHWRETHLSGTGWLRSFGRLSYECYLTHMFVVLGVLWAFNKSGAGAAHRYLWTLPALALSWLLGYLVARFYSIPCERVLRR